LNPHSASKKIKKEEAQNYRMQKIEKS
jgi:hypothetical protein